MSGSDAVREDRFASRVPPKGGVLRWRHQGTTHVAVNVGGDPAGSWRIAGRDGEFPWEYVRAQIGNNPAAGAASWVEVPTLDRVDFGDAEAGAWALGLDRRGRVEGARA